MIVGIIGKIGHGKDTVADFIRRNSETVYTVRRFADPIKECVASILNCSVFDLEDRNFKERDLGDEYAYYEVQDPFFETLTKLSRDEFEKVVDDHGGDEVLFRHNFKVIETRTTARKMLQTLGTEWGRNMIHPNIWVNSMMHLYEQSRINGSNGNYPDWLMPDVRFPNEANAVKEHNGILIKVINPHIKSDDTHLSERLVEDIAADYTIINGGNLQHLEELTLRAIKELGI